MDQVDILTLDSENCYQTLINFLTSMQFEIFTHKYEHREGELVPIAARVRI